MITAVPDPHRGTKGTCLGPCASGGPAWSSVYALMYCKKRGKKGKKRKLEEEGKGKKKLKFKQRVRLQ